MRHEPCRRSPSSAAKQASESNAGQHSQSIEPSRPTSAAVSQSPDQGIILDFSRHAVLVKMSVVATLRLATPGTGAARPECARQSSRSIVVAIASSASGNRRRQFGC